MPIAVPVPNWDLINRCWVRGRDKEAEAQGWLHGVQWLTRQWALVPEPSNSRVGRSLRDQVVYLPYDIDVETEDPSFNSLLGGRTGPS